MAEETNIGKLLLVGLGLYLAYEYFYAPGITASAAPATPGISPAPVAPGASGTAAAGTNAKHTPIPTAAQLDQAASAAGYPAPHAFNVYGWNYWYSILNPTVDLSAWPLYPSESQAHPEMHTSADYVAELNRYLRSAGLAGVSRSLTDGTAFRRGVSLYSWN